MLLFDSESEYNCLESGLPLAQPADSLEHILESHGTLIPTRKTQLVV